MLPFGPGKGPLQHPGPLPGAEPGDITPGLPPVPLELEGNPG